MKKLLLKIFFSTIILLTSILASSQTINLNIGGETGTVDSGLPIPLVESYSRNGSSSVNGSNGPYVADSLHYINVDSVSWAREGNYVLKFYADGSNFPYYDYAYRVELATSHQSLKYSPGDERFYSLSFFPPQNIWDSVTQYSTIISQWKQYGGGNPNAAIRLSNEGDYKLFILSAYHWSSSTSEGDLFGIATPGEWNDLKYYIKHSEGSDGAIKVWFNGVLSYEYNGATMHTYEDGYIKFGMYTEIRDERILYFDAINITDTITVPMQDWATNQVSSTVIEENYKNRRLIKVVDILGRKPTVKEHTLLFYIYDDGTVEKKIIIE